MQRERKAIRKYIRRYLAGPLHTFVCDDARQPPIAKCPRMQGGCAVCAEHLRGVRDH